MVVAGSGERVSSRFIMSHKCSIGERSGGLAGQGSCYTLRRVCCIAAAVCGHALSCWKSTPPSYRRNDSSTWLTGQCSGHSLLTLQKHQIRPHVVTMAPTPLSLRWCLCIVGERTLEDDVHQVYAVLVYFHNSQAHTEPTFITEDNRASFHSPVDSFTAPG